MADLSVDCPICSRANRLPVDHAGDTFTCASCGQTSPFHAATVSGSEQSPNYLVGETIGDCRLLERVGEGGYGTVYRANDPVLGRLVAVKVIGRELGSSADFARAFVRDVVASAQFSHPNVAAIHKVGRDERLGLHFVVSEFVEGRTLTDLVEERGGLAPDEAIPVMIQACDALAAAHESGLLHRSVTPGNLMLCGGGVLKITDFGMPTSVLVDGKVKTLGVPQWMSPEQFEGKTVDGRTDVYALGATAYYLLSRRRPFPGNNAVQIVYSILRQEPQPLPELNGQVSPELWSIARRMIAKAPRDRYQSLRETADDLRRFQALAYTDRGTCPACGAKNPKGRKFCRVCGVAFAASPAPQPEETPPIVTAMPEAGDDAAVEADVRRILLQAAEESSAKGDLRGAAASYRRLLEVDPSHDGARKEIARLASVLKVLDDIPAKVDAADVEPLQSALGRLENLLRRFPESEEIRQRRDEVKGALDWRKVERLLVQAGEAETAGRVGEALGLLDKALRADPARADVRARRDEFAQRLADVAEWRRKAAEALAAGRFAEALGLANEVLRYARGDSAMQDLKRRAEAGCATQGGEPSGASAAATLLAVQPPRLDPTLPAKGRSATSRPSSGGSQPRSRPPEDLSRDWRLRGCDQIDFEGAKRVVVGRVVLLALLGRGGMGSVYYGVNPRLGTEVAVKLLSRDLAERDPSFAERFVREARLAARLKSEHLVGVIDVDEDEDSGSHYIVMDYVHGETASDWARRAKQSGAEPNERDALHVSIAATKGLAAAHAQEIVHRDVKPSNILVPHDDGALPALERAKLSDLGLARAISTEPDDRSLTATHGGMGTLGYMAPEQLSSARSARKPADVFGMAATLYSLLTGRAPFAGEDTHQTMLRTMRAEFDPVRSLRPDVSAATAALVERCLRSEVGERCPDAPSLLVELERCRAALG